ncbi:unnamed protein product, partial [marine sediment metagenome]
KNQGDQQEEDKYELFFHTKFYSIIFPSILQASQTNGDDSISLKKGKPFEKCTKIEPSLNIKNRSPILSNESLTSWQF